MSVRLTAFLADGPAVRVIIPAEGSYVLGRGSDADLQLTDASVSRAHARLSAGPDGAWRVEDLASKNGTQINGRYVDEASIAGNAWLSLGGAHVLLEHVDAKEALSAKAAEDQRVVDASRFRQTVNEKTTISGVFENLAGAIIELTSCDRCSIWLAEDAKDPTLAFRKGEAQPGESFSTIGETIKRGVEVISNDIEGVAAYAKRQSIMLGGVRALICLPFEISGAAGGAVYADSQKPGKFFSELDVELLRGVTRHAALTLSGLRLRDQIADLST